MKWGRAASGGSRPWRVRSVRTVGRWCTAAMVAVALVAPAPADALAGSRRAAHHGPAAAAGHGKVDGSVVTTARHPVPRALVRLRAAGHVLRHHHGGRHAAHTGPRGRFAIKAPAGRDLVVASKRGLGRARAFTTVVAGQSRSVTLTLRAPCVVHGRVVHRRGVTTPQPPSRTPEIHDAPRPAPAPAPPAVHRPTLPPAKFPPPKPGPQPR